MTAWDERGRRARAEHLLDWLRLSVHPLGSEQTQRLMRVMSQLDHEFYCRSLEYLSPSRVVLWTSEDEIRQPARYVEMRCLSRVHLLMALVSSIDFLLLFIHSDDALLSNDSTRELLVRSLASSGTPSHAKLRGALRLISHRLSATTIDNASRDSLLILVHCIVKTMISLPPASRAELVLFVLRLSGVRTHLHSSLSSSGREGASRLVLNSNNVLILFLVLRALLKDLHSFADADGQAVLTKMANSWVTMSEEISSLRQDQVCKIILSIEMIFDHPPARNNGHMD